MSHILFHFYIKLHFKTYLSLAQVSFYKCALKVLPFPENFYQNSHQYSNFFSSEKQKIFSWKTKHTNASMSINSIKKVLFIFPWWVYTYRIWEEKMKWGKFHAEPNDNNKLTSMSAYLISTVICISHGIACSLAVSQMSSRVQCELITPFYSLAIKNMIICMTRRSCGGSSDSLSV